MARPITLHSPEATGLRLGPGTGNIQTPGQIIVFQEGYASFDEADFPNWRAWLAGAPPIEVLEGDEVPATESAEHVCPECGKAFATAKALKGHRLSHVPRKAKAPKEPPAPAQ